MAHAIAPAPPVPLEGGGLRGRPLAWTEAGDLGLWGTALDAGVKLERADAMEHHRVVERICATQPCLPVRFGTAFASIEAARGSIEARAAALHAALERVSGKSELAVTLLWRSRQGPSAAPSAATGPGRRYMEERRTRYSAEAARRARASELVERLVAELSAERALVWHEICTSPDVAVSLAVMVPTDQAIARKAVLERTAGRFDDVLPVVNGPWPPYTFARIDEAGSSPRPPR
jgi:hypothetical protein